MLYKFKSKAAGDLLMLEADGRQLLKIMLGDDPVRGILTAPQLPAAIAALEQAVACDEAKRLALVKNSGESPASDDDITPEPNPIRLAQRASPMLKLLARSLTESVDVVWGV